MRAYLNSFQVVFTVAVCLVIVGRAMYLTGWNAGYDHHREHAFGPPPAWRNPDDANAKIVEALTEYERGRREGLANPNWAVIVGSRWYLLGRERGLEELARRRGEIQ